MSRKPQKETVQSTLFATKLKELRKRLGYTQSYVAKRLGYEGSTISRWESGERPRDDDALIQLVRFFARPGGLETLEEALDWAALLDKTLTPDQLEEAFKGKFGSEEIEAVLKERSDSQAIHASQETLDKEEAERLEKIFTDAEELRDFFEELIETDGYEELSVNTLVIEGRPGAGKTVLLKMYKAMCRQHKVPVALVRTDEIKKGQGIRGVLESVRQDWSRFDVQLPKLSANFERYYRIQDKVDRKEPFAPKDADFLRKEVEHLTSAFLDDVANVAPQRRLVLLWDTYERVDMVMDTLDKWANNLVRSRHDNMVIVIAGRTFPWITWMKESPGWQNRAHSAQLMPMTKEFAIELASKYYEHTKGHPPQEPEIYAMLAEDAQGLPLKIATPIEFLKYGTKEELQAQQPAAVQNTVTQLKEGCPEHLWESLEAAAVLHWFDRDLLEAVLGKEMPAADYNQLCGYESFIYRYATTRKYAMHDAYHDDIGQYLSSQDPGRYRTWHERAAAHFKRTMEYASEGEKESLFLERLYHLLLSENAPLAIEESVEAVGQAVTYYKRSFGESVVSLLSQHLHQEPYRPWLTYFQFLVISMNPKIEQIVPQAEKLDALLETPHLDPRMRALSALALARAPGEAKTLPKRRIALLREAIASDRLSPHEQAMAFHYLADVQRGVGQGAWHEAIENYQTAIEAYRALTEGAAGGAEALSGLAYTYLLMGRWNESVEAAERSVELARPLGNRFYLAGIAKGLGWSYTYRGELNRALKVIKEVRKLAEGDEANVIRIRRRLAEIYDRQKRWTESVPIYCELKKEDEQKNRAISRATQLALLGISHFKQGKMEAAERFLVESLTPKDENGNILPMDPSVEPMALNALGDLYVAMSLPNDAHSYFERCRLLSQDRPYHLAKATLGLLQVELARQRVETLPATVQQIAALCREQTYHDLLAQLSLIEGHFVWEGTVPGWGHGAEAASRLYQQALMHALHYNRFLLDDVLWGGNITTTVEPIITYCQARDDEGRGALVALRDWWLAGRDDLSPEPISLLEAERRAREQEPGDGRSQLEVVKQIEEVLRG